MSAVTRACRMIPVLLMLTLCLCPATWAQSTTDGAIGGTVSDSHGAVVANATVLVHNNGTNAEKSIATDASGYYRIVNLPSGSYTVTVSNKGFANY
ncbi:MAG TPA: carboxypeptidase-like regulatory domain-containing protein, partial [Alphaproteobacteria bacterium]|nr:carboxypeptidase-like regulatory domain-containing protein [Alphaproteobacteria bacterium]